MIRNYFGPNNISKKGLSKGKGIPGSGRQKPAGTRIKKSCPGLQAKFCPQGLKKQLKEKSPPPPSRRGAGNFC